MQPRRPRPSKPEVPRNSFEQRYFELLKRLQLNPPDGYEIMQSALYKDDGPHPVHHIDYECMFASNILEGKKTSSILDVGSYRHFMIGLLAIHKVTTVDVRPRATEFVMKNETVLVCDAKQLQLDSDLFDVVISLCALEHFGLGRYGDAFDLGADTMAFKEMRRVLKPGGLLIFTTTLKKGKPSICFNIHRTYNYEAIMRFCEGLTLVREEFFNSKTNKIINKHEITDLLGDWDLYCGCWAKQEPS